MYAAVWSPLGVVVVAVTFPTALWLAADFNWFGRPGLLELGKSSGLCSTIQINCAPAKMRYRVYRYILGDKSKTLEDIHDDMRLGIEEARSRNATSPTLESCSGVFFRPEAPRIVPPSYKRFHSFQARSRAASLDQSRSGIKL